MLISILSIALGNSKSIIYLNTVSGQAIAKTADHDSDFYELVSYYHPQKTSGYCGLASLAIVLNALHIEAPADSAFLPANAHSQDNLLWSDKTLKITQHRSLLTAGLTIEQLKKIAELYNAKVKIISLSDKTSYEEAKSTIILAIDDKNGFVIINYDRKKLSQKGGGHFSTIGGYDSHTDRFLIMDVAGYKYPMVWVDAQDLIKAASTKDGSRGIMLIKKGS
jgi:hypothetical protein